MSTYKKRFGKKGEEIALDFLLSKNYKFIDKNFQMWGGEIDLIVKDNSTKEIVFVEVKTRTKESWQALDETLSERQLSNIKKIIPFFLLKKGLEEKDWRIDHIGIIYNHRRIYKIEHFIAVN